MQTFKWRSGGKAFTALGAILFAIAMSGAAQAQVQILYPGNGSFGDNILFNQAGLPSDGFHVEGVLNATPSFIVNFDSTESLHANGGQARVEPTDGRLNEICVSLNPGNGFTEYIFDAYRDGLKGSVDLTVTATFQALTGGPVGTMTSVIAINNGSNFVDVVADSGYVLTQVCFSTPDLPDTADTEYGLLDLRQNRISGAQVINLVPEGNSLAMLGLGGLPILWMGIRRRTTAAKRIT